MTAVAAALGLVQARHLARHPWVLVGVGLAVLVMQYGLRGPEGNGLAALTQAVPFYLGPAAFFAANLAASRDRRAGTSELVTASPTTSRRRASGALLAVGGPVLLALGLVGAAGAAHWISGAGGPPRATVADVASGPLVVCGGGLLGVATAYWAPFRTAPILVMAGLVLWCQAGRMEWQLLTPYVEVPAADAGARVPGSMAWHDLYLGCLALLAATAALLATPGPRRWLLIAGVVLAAGAALAGWRQLP